MKTNTNLSCIHSIISILGTTKAEWSEGELDSYLGTSLHTFLAIINSSIARREKVVADSTTREAEQKAALAKIEELMKTAQEIATKAGVPFVPPTTEEEFQSSDSWSSSNCW
jgi:hypothetical protein